MKTLLVIYFLFNGQWGFAQGWHPVNYETEAQCQESLINVHTYLRVNNVQIPYKANCYVPK